MTDKKRLQWQCRRGMLELELFLNDFLEFDYDDLSNEKKTQFEELLTVIDPVLFDYLMGIQEPENLQHREMINLIKTVTSRRSRIR
ncbi:MAG: succinate dehydrogenase assembly factor 2 [gamma proteobacterium symbiont of Bathyaustriella thionipta]|nr:succinate dehydrogenase assembly factor 2 [gamma proteobacterium symbiont of Bathyaustriella thionipta]MCU7951198.1 succinate dehydrogenase assembly factor 2 [gamma proteobacterium symbiont of Bathyaustriella thionipta]MCU7952180.1 succinate dehydrogenase assembly factor 2 [gamma proteobacterium symbiont of Bathyaustriella thionipta]MCU7957713.1 succinate dehydrogenase assembly factor 2 [gamma proteobacterium symbiont of Bathyaustriella thionipta]MCU7966878.1 succinate dehydrogenase assembly